MKRSTTMTTKANSQRRVLRVRIDGSRFQALQDLAADVDLTAAQLAAVWLREHVDQVAMASAVWLSDGFAGRIGSSSNAGSARLVAGESRSGTGTESHGRKGSLHAEIVEVLKDRGAPMTAADIAAAIRRRGRYTSPRSGHPITGAAVSRRIANPYYRSLFERAGRQVGLADDAST